VQFKGKHYLQCSQHGADEFRTICCEYLFCREILGALYRKIADIPDLCSAYTHGITGAHEGEQHQPSILSQPFGAVL
jgi:hypothetical protein